jgi:hypothetical protein
MSFTKRIIKFEIKIIVAETQSSGFLFNTTALLNEITLGQTISDYNNRMITLSELPFPLNDTSLRKLDLLKLPNLIVISDC